MSDTPTPSGDADTTAESTAESTATGTESTAGAAPQGPPAGPPPQAPPPGSRPGWGWRPGPGWRGPRRPLHLLLAGFVGLILGCLLGGVFVGGLAMVASHHDGYRRHHQYQRDRDDWGPGGGYRPGQPGQRPLPQPTQS